jgi:hypothetical protein
LREGWGREENARDYLPPLSPQLDSSQSGRKERKERVEKGYALHLKSFSSSGLHYVVSFISSLTTKHQRTLESWRKEKE